MSIEIGTEIHFSGPTSIDYSVAGVVVAIPTHDPDGDPVADLYEVRWPDGDFEILTADEVAPGHRGQP